MNSHVWQQNKKNTLDMTLRQVHSSHLMIGFWPRHLSPRTNVHVRRCPEPPNRPGQVCRSLQKKLKNQHPEVFLPISMNFNELFAFNWNVVNFRSFFVAAQLRNHQPTVAILEVLLLHRSLLLLELESMAAKCSLKGQAIWPWLSKLRKRNLIILNQEVLKSSRNIK